VPSSRPELATLRIPGSAAAWEGLGFAVVDGAVPLGGVRIELGRDPEWVLGTPDAPEVEHPNGATGIDHIVVLTPDLDAAVERLRSQRLDYRRTREAGDGMRQAFFVLGPCLLELAGPVEGEERLWGVTLVARDLAPFGGTPKDAVQPGRRITTVKDLGFPVAVMTPR
jgi:hypothetical protein